MNNGFTGLLAYVVPLATLLASLIATATSVGTLRIARRTAKTVRDDIYVSAYSQVVGARLTTYPSLWALIQEPAPDSDTREWRDLDRHMTEWYATGGGLLLTMPARQDFTAARIKLRDPDTNIASVSEALAALRQRLKEDVRATGREPTKPLLEDSVR